MKRNPTGEDKRKSSKEPDTRSIDEMSASELSSALRMRERELMLKTANLNSSLSKASTINPAFANAIDSVMTRIEATYQAYVKEDGQKGISVPSYTIPMPPSLATPTRDEKVEIAVAIKKMNRGIEANTAKIEDLKKKDA